MRIKDAAYRGWWRVRRVPEPVLLRLNTLGSSGYHLGAAAPVGVSAYCVYRKRNESLVRQLVTSLAPGSQVHLHLLDGTVEDVGSLAQHVRATGPGLRIPLLSALIERHPPQDGDHLLILDDDVSFPGSSLGRFCGLAAAGGLDIAQPAHRPESNFSFAVTRFESLSTVRQTAFVEVGPVVLLSPTAREQVVPFHASAGMGWGLDLRWSLLRRTGLVLGVVDATPIIHHGAVGVAYDLLAEDVAYHGVVADLDVTDVQVLNHNVGLTWRPWQRAPKWLADGSAVGAAREG